jgi:hypothetical protein
MERVERATHRYFATKQRNMWYDKVPKAINFRAPAQKIQLKILKLKDAIHAGRLMWRRFTQES